MTPEERALLNEQTMLGDRDRSFCERELQPITAKNRRYIERVMANLAQLRYTPTEVSLAYAYLLSIPVDSLRKVSRDFDKLDEGIDGFIASLPSPIPPEEVEKLDEIVKGDIAEIKASQVRLEPKPGSEKDREEEPPNS